MAKKNEVSEFSLDTTGFVQESLGLPPYWAPSDEKNGSDHHGKFYAKLIAFDRTDPEFLRWVFVANHDLLCYRGPSDDREEVLVRSGEKFSVSHYAQFASLNEYFGLNVLICATLKQKVKKGSVWRFTIQLPPVDYKTLMDRRSQHANQALQGVYDHASPHPLSLESQVVDNFQSF